MINPLFGYSEATEQRIKAQQKYKEEIQADMEKLANSIPKTLARKKEYVSSIKNEEEEIITEEEQKEHENNSMNINTSIAKLGLRNEIDEYISIVFII